MIQVQVQKIITQTTYSPRITTRLSKFQQMRANTFSVAQNDSSPTAVVEEVESTEGAENTEEVESTGVVVGVLKNTEGVEEAIEEHQVTEVTDYSIYYCSNRCSTVLEYRNLFADTDFIRCCKNLSL